MFKHILVIFIIISSLLVSGQDVKKVKQLFQNAEEHFLYEDYELALPNYLELIDIGWDNSNMHYNIGMCYLNIDGQALQAIPYLEKASVNVSRNYRQGNYKEEGAPEETWFYLAKSYRLDGQFDKSIEAYGQYRLFLPPTDVYYLDFIDLQIQSCKRAQQMMTTPIKFAKTQVSFGEDGENYKPAISGDEKSVAYTAFQEVKDPYSQEKLWFELIYYSTFDGVEWKRPKDISFDIASDGFFSTCYLSYEGDYLLLFRDDYGNGNIYYSELEGRRWSEIKKLPKQISSRTDETHASLSKDGNTMYFVSENREGGFGGRDIYKSEKDSKGRWGVAVNLGDVINTTFEEDTPFLSEDGNTLYFASEAHTSMGGFDIFKSTLGSDGEWTEPQNLGYPINDGTDNTFYLPIGTENSAYVSMQLDGDTARKIYRIDFPKTERVIEVVADNPTVDDDNLDMSETTGSENAVVPVTETKTIVVPTEYDLKGSLSLQDNKELDNSFYIHVAKMDGEVIASLSPNTLTGEFKTKLKPGGYKVTAFGNGYDAAERTIFISEDQQSADVLTFLSMTPLAVSSGEYFTIKSVLFDYNSAQLNREAQEEIERLSILMEKNPSLYIEVSGFSDAHGNEVYNKRLSMQRSRAVVSYIREKGIDQSRFVTKAFGASNFVAINENPDGSDNPEGRKLNRRVDMKVIKSNDDNIKVENIYVPDELVYKDQLTYTILLINSDEVLAPSYFNSSGESVNNVWMFTTATGYLYTVGQFKHKSDALPVMNMVVDAGFPDAEIISSLEYNELIQNSSNFYKSKMSDQDNAVYTIQLMALQTPKEDDAFAGLSEVETIHGDDGYYRYIWGEFIGKTSARQALDDVIEQGYYDAFIVDISKFRN